MGPSGRRFESYCSEIRVENMSEYLREVAKKVKNDLCGVSVYGDGLNPSSVQTLAEDYLKLTANRDFGWLPPMKMGLFKWQCVVCKRKYFRYKKAYNCCIYK